MPNDNTLFIKGLDDVNEQPKKPTLPTPDAVKKMKEELGLVPQSESDDLQTINSEISSLSGKVKEYEALDSQKNNSQSKTYGMYSGGMSVLDAVKPVKEVNDKYAELGKNISRDRERLAELNRKRDEIIKAQVSPLKDAIKQKRAELEQEYAEVIPIGQNIERQMRSGGLTFDDYYNIKEFDRGFLNLNTKTKEQSDLENRARTPYKEFIAKKKALDISEQYLNKLEKEADISPDNYLKALGQGFANHDWIDLATLGAKSMAENFNLAEISKRVKNGTASEEEKTALTLYDQFNQLASTKDKPITYDIAQSFIQSLPYMADIAISGGVRGAITKGVTKGIGRTVIGLSDNVAGAIANKTAQKVATGAIKNTAKIATQAAGAIASSPLQVNMYSNIARNELDNYVIGYDDNGEINVRKAKDFKNGFQNTMRALMTTASATFSESSGKVFDNSFAMLGKKFGLGKINNRYINDLSKKFAEIKKATNVQGTLGETFEEYVNKFTDNIVTDPREEEGRDEWANFFDTREGLTIIGSTILTQAMFGVGNLPNRYDRMKLKSDVKRYESVLPKDIKDGLIKAMSAETANEQVDALASLNLGEIKDPAIRRNVVDYISSKIKYDFAKGVAQGDQELYRIRKVDESVNSIIHDTDGVLYVASVTDNDRPDNEVYILSGNVNGDKNEPVVILDEDGSKVMTTMANVRVRNQMDAGTLREQLILAELTKQQQEQAEEEGLEKAESLGINTQEIPVVGEEVALPDGSAIKIMAVDNNGVTFDMLDPEGMTMDTKTLSFEEYSAMQNPQQQPTAETAQVETSQPEQVAQPVVKTLTDGKTALNITLNENNEGISNEVYDNLPDAEKVVKTLSKRFSKLEFQVIDQSGDDPFTPDKFVISVKPKNLARNEGKVEGVITAEESIAPEAVANQVSQQAEEGQEQEVVVDVSDSNIQELNNSEIQYIQNLINDPNEPQDQKQFWEDDLQDLINNPKRYWDAFAITDESDPRQQQIKRIQEYYGKDVQGQQVQPEVENQEQVKGEEVRQEEGQEPIRVDESNNNVANTPVVETQSNDRQIEQLVNDIEGRVADVQKMAEIKAEERNVNPEPTDAQKEAGNYAKGHIKVRGLDITIENAKGSTRKGKDAKGNAWKVRMNNAYGYFKRTQGKDGDQIDVFLGENPESGKIFVVDQIRKTGDSKLFDEHKVMMGFKSSKDAKEAYLSNYSKGWDGFGAITEMSEEQFKEWLGDGTRTKQPVAWSDKKKLNPNAFLPKRAVELMKSDPQSLDEAIIQHILRGGKFSRNDYIRHSGFKEGSDEVNKAAFNGLINGKDQQEGTQFDTFLGLLGNDFGKDDGIDLINSIVDVINLSTRPNLARRLIEIADASQENTPHTDNDYAQALAEQEEALRLAEEELFNEVMMEFYSKYPQITKEEYAELFNFGENDYDEQGNEPATDGDLGGVQGEIHEDGRVDNEGDGQDEDGGVAGIEMDGRAEGEKPKEELLKNTPFIETGETRIDDTYESTDPEYNQRKVLVPVFINSWHYADNTDPDTETFTSYDEAIKDLERKGRTSDLGKYYEPVKETSLALKESWVDSNNEQVEVGDILNYDEWAYRNKDNAFVKAFGESSLIESKVFSAREESSQQLESEVYTNIHKSLVEEYESNGVKLKISTPSSGKYRTITITDQDDNEVGSIKLRIADHSYNPANNDSDAKDGNFISVEIANKNETAGKFHGKFGLQFDGDNTFEEVVAAVNERIEEIIDGWNLKDQVPEVGNMVDQPKKKPWEMTAKERWDAERKRAIAIDGKAYVDRHMATLEEYKQGSHRKLVEQALSEGKPVPAEVLKDYPELSSPENKTTENSSQVDAIKTVISLMDEQEDTINKLKAIASKPQKTAKDNQDKTQLEYKLGQIEEKLNKAQALVSIPAEKLPAVTKLVRESLADEKAIDARIESLNSQRKNKEKEFNSRNGVFGDNKEIADKAKGQQALFAGDIFEASTNTLANTIKPITDSIAKLEEEKQRNAKILADKVELELHGAQQEIKEEVKEEPKGDLFLKASEIIETSPKGRVLSDINELIHTAKNIQQLRQLLELPYVKQTFGLVQEVNSAINYLERHPEKQEKKVDEILEQSTPEVKPEFAGNILESNNKTYSIPETFNLSTFSKFDSELNEGNIQVDDFKKAFNVLKESKASIIDELNKKTKAELLANMNSMGQYRYKNENKDSIVKALYSDMLMTFSFGSISYGMGETMEQAIAKKVDATTQEQINDHVDEVKKRKEEYLERVKAHKKAISNPETLDEFKVFIKYNGIEKLSPEQKATYDDLVTDKVLENRSDDAKKGAIVEKVDLGDVEMSIAETKHTKTGVPLFVVRLSARIPEEQYKELNKKAKQLGGYYSSYAKDGAIPGFQFKTLEQAQSFSGLKTQDASNIELKEEAKEQKVEQKISKLRENAQKIIERVDAELNRDRLTNTAKRAREAASVEARLNEEKRIAQTMLNIADAIENGDVKLLDGIKAKTHIELLDNLIKSAKYAEISSKAESYSDRMKYEGEPATLETIEYLKHGFYPSIYGTTLKDVINKVEYKPGLKQLATKWSKKLSGLGEYDSYQVTNDTDISEIEQLFNGLSESDKKYNRIGTVLADHNRLKAMGIENDSMLRAALREYIQFRGKKQAPDKVKELERAIVGRAKNLGVDFFPTPAETAKMMVELAGVTEDMEVLEPSAGNGNIADQIKQVGVMPDVIEISSELSEILKAKGYNVVADDFMQYAEKKYDRIIMNPPFSNGMDGDHVKHAYELLKPGGKLVAIVGEGTFIRNDKKATAFREWLDKVGGTETKLESGTFQDKTLLNTTGANARVVVIEKEGEFIEEPANESVGKQEVVNDNVAQDNNQEEQPQLEAVEPINDIQDFGEKVGGARKDMGITRKAKEKDSMPAWRRKYEYANPDGSIMLIGKVDTSKPFIVNFFEEMKGMFGKQSRQIIVTEVKDGRITKDPILFRSEEEAENYIPIYEVHRQGYRINQKGDEFVIYKRASTGKALEFDKFPTIEDAQAYMNSTEGATSLLNRKRETFSIPNLEKVQRTGKDYRQGKNISTDEFYKTFGFRGGEFGKWVKPEERQSLLNIAYDSLMDMANLLNLPPKALSLNGELSIAFGARGIGGLEGGAKAHYEGNRAVINMTRLNGAGSLAHEWMHALDNYFGLQDAKKDYSRDDKGELISKDYFFSEVKTYKAGMRPELRKALQEILDNLVKKTVTRDIAQDAKQKLYDGFERSILQEADRLKARFTNGVRRYVYNRKTKQREEVVVKATAEQLEQANALIDKITSGNSDKPKWQPITANYLGDHSYISDDIKAIDEIYKSVFGGTGLKRNGDGYYNFGYYAEKLYHTKEELDKAKNGEQETVKVKTDLLDNSSRFDASRVSPYYSKPIEMLARAFEQYMVTKLGTEKSDYLQYDKSPVYKALYDITPYPEGAELETLNKAFDNLFNVIKTEEKEDGNVVMFRANNPTFYANSEKALESLSDNNRTPEQWKAELLKNGAKESELNYMGWNQFVEGKKTLTKNDLTEFVNSNKVQVEEVVKETIETILSHPDFDTQALFGGQNGTTKYSSYTTPGGKNYREVLITLPENTKYKLSDKEIEQKAIEEGFRFDVFPNKVLIFKDGEVWDEQKDMATVISVMRNRYKDGTIVHTNTFTSSHFSEPNIAAHVRLSEFTDKQGRRVLLVDEVQSDWAQEGKKKGFKEKQQDLPIKSSELKSGDKIGQYTVVEVLDDVQQVELIDEQTGKNEWFAFKIVDKWLSDSDQSKYDNRIPDMPFKKTDQWVGLGMKWAIQYASKNGFDGVAWTTGEQQAQRYDLSKQVDRINWTKRDDKFDISPTKNGKHIGFPVGTKTTNLTKTEVANLVGKEMADKIEAETGKNYETGQLKQGVLSGLDLKVGGEGMKAFYDNIIPSWVNKYAKKFGTKTTTTEIDTTPDIVEHGIDLNTGEVGKDKNYRQVHYLPISDSMVRGVAQGQPLFRSVSEMLNGSESQRKFLAIQSEFNRIAELSNGAITAELVRTVDELPEVLRSNGVSESSINEILESVKKGSIAGFFIDDKAYVISDNSIDEKEAVRTLIHERGLHGGIRILIPNEKLRIKVLNKVFESVGEDTFNKMVIENGGRPDQYKNLSNWQKGEECLAFLSEKIISEKDLTPKERGVWEWLKNYINNLIAKVLRFDVNSIKFTDKELAHIVRASVNANYVTTNATSGRGRTQEETSSQENREGDRDSSVLEGTDGGDNVHDNVQYPDSRRSRCVQHIKNALRKEELNNLPYNHGTFAEFKQFDFNKVGEGTGEKIHGHGLYFNITTKDKEVGKSYARMGTLYTPKGMAYMNEVGNKLGKLSQSYLNKAFLKNHGNEEREAVLNTLKGWLSTATQEKNREALSSLVDFVENKQFPNDRYLMTGTLKTRNKEFNFLHWDDPLFKDQWDAIIDRLKVEQFNENELIEKVAEKTYSYDMDGGYNYNDPTGASVYRSLSEILGGDVVASNFLRRAGIDGTMFFDKAVNDGDSRVNVCLFSDEGVEVNDTVMFRTAGEYVEGASNATKLSKTEKAQEFVQDRMYSVRKLLDVVQKRSGVVEDFSNIYVIENLAASKADAAMDAYRDNELKNVTVAVANVMNATGKSYNEITDYLIAKHTPERNEYFRSQGRTGERFAGEWTDEEAKAITDAFEQEVGDELVSSLWKSINEATDYTLNRTYQYGFINKDEYKALKERWKFYVPLRGWKVKDEIDSIWDYADRDSERTFDGMAKAKGRTSKADDPIAHIASMAHSMVVSGEKNMIKQSAFRLANANKDMNDLFTVKKIYQVITGKDADGNDIVTDTYEKPEQKLYDEGKVITKTNRNHNRYRSGGESKQHEVSLWINGEKAVVIFDDPNVASAINYENMFQDKFTLGLQNTVGRFTRFLSSVFTSKNPAFIPINLLRDLGYSSMSHLIRDDGNFTGYAKNLAKAKKAISRKLKGKADPKNDSLDHLYEQFLKYGGETGWVHLDSIDRIKGKLQKDIRKLDKTSGFARKVLVDGIVNNAGELLDRMATVSENISRFATFLASVEQGKSYQKAAYDAKNITVNFNRKGRATGFFGSIYAFFNASIQGGNNVISMAVNNKGKFAFTAAMFYGAAILNAALHDATEDDDDETYFDNSDYVRQNNLVINIGNGEYLSLPLPHGFRAFYALGDMTYMLMKGMITEGDLVKNGLSAVISNVSPVDPVGVINKKGELDPRPIIPTFAVPFYDIAVNSDFSNRRIYREAYTPKDEMFGAESQRYDKNVSPVFRAITDGLFKLGGGDPSTGLKESWDKKGNKHTVSDFADWNPSKAEHIFTYYTGGTGKFFNDLVKFSGNIITESKEAMKNNDELSKTLLDVYTGVDFNNAPVINRLIREPRSYEFNKEYYAIMRDLNSMDFAISRYNKVGDRDIARKLKRSEVYRVADRAKEKIDRIMDRITRGNLTAEKFEEYDKEITAIKKETVEKIRKLKGNDTESGRD